MKFRGLDPRRLDVAALAADGGQLEGCWPLTELPRVWDLVPEEARNEEADVRWSAEGERRRPLSVEPQTWLRLTAHATVWLECQRCLQPVAVPLSLEPSFRFVPGEDAAARLDAESEDDVLELTPTLDLRELIEDELLLALPIVPRHETCVDALPMQHDADDDEPALSPFAALEALKSGRRQ
jgi:uncharacterized protein